VLKNAIDWVSRPRATTPLQGKPAAVAGATTGAFGAVWAQAELRKVLASTGARVVDSELPVGRAQEAFDDSGALICAAGDRRDLELLEALAAEVEARGELAVAA
jgi:chromate reductase, NAD(P)H dehydrogenase (quinone)